jgi:energy-coupling factor transporter ATP-binding protein EcfA2
MHEDSPSPRPPTNDKGVARPTPDEGFTELQRCGLQGLLDLSCETAVPAESEIEDRYRQAASGEEQLLQGASAGIESRAREKLGVIEKAHAQLTAQIRAEHQSATLALEANHRAAMDRLASMMHDMKSEYDRQLQDELLLADTVAQASFERLRQECKAVEQKAEEERKRLAQLQKTALAELNRYRCNVPPLSAASAKSAASSADPAAEAEQQTRVAEDYLDAMRRIRAPRFFMGLRRLILLFVLCLLTVGGLGALTYFQGFGAERFKLWGPFTFLATTLFTELIGWAVRQDGRGRLLEFYGPLADSVRAANQALDRMVAQARQRHQSEEAKANLAERQNPEKRAIGRRFEALLAETRKREAVSRQDAEQSRRRQQAELDQRRDAAVRDASAQAERNRADVRQQSEGGLAAARATYEQNLAAIHTRHQTQRAALFAAWEASRRQVERYLAAADVLASQRDAAWAVDESPKGQLADGFTALVPYGHWRLDLARLSPSVPDLASIVAGHPPTALTPAVLAVPDHCSLLLQTGRAGRQQAIDTLRVIMLRLLMGLRPGRVRFTIIDPVGLGESFAGFMHLVDYEEALVGGRIWTDSEQIEARLTELTSHMETVIQKYLRNEFPSIDAYNRQAGQLAEPYRFLVIADFPTNFTEGAARRLGSIISSGPRCGVFTLIMHDQRLGLPPELPMEDLAGGSLRLVHDGERFHAEDDLLKHFPLLLDGPPPEEVLTGIMHEVGRRAKHAFRVEVPFDAIAPAAPQRWTRDATTDLSIPIGHVGAIRLQQFSLGRGLAQHALVTGKTGSGKSTLLHVIITNLALWYSPEEVELYLVDFKKGVEFKTYVTHALPHARAVAIESDREFGVSVLQRLDAEMTRRGELFRAAGVQDLPAYRAASGKVLPRTLLIVDEFQVFFSEDDKLAQDAVVLLDRLVRQGRAFGIHVLLGSQSLAGYMGLARSTVGQMAVRIALQCSEADSQLILDDTNVAARLLSRPGEAIYNDAGGLIAGNSNFQIAWLPDERQSGYLADVHELAAARGWSGEPAIVFEGNVLADIRQNRFLARLIESPRPASIPAPQIWLGEPVAIKDPTSLVLRRQSGANLILVGQRDDVALSLLAAGMLCLGLQHAPQTTRFVMLGGAAAEPSGSGGLHDVAALLPHAVQWVDWREVPEAIAELTAEMQRRIEGGPGDAPVIYLLVYGVQRYRVLRRSEDSFSFSTSDETAPPATDRQFAELLREGPAVGIHVLAWSDTLASLERALDRQSLREFDNRVLFQMSAADSSNLIDSPEANRLGLYGAMFFSEERGLLEKFRPYGPFAPDWLKHVRECLDRKAAM